MSKPLTAFFKPAESPAKANKAAAAAAAKRQRTGDDETNGNDEGKSEQTNADAAEPSPKKANNSASKGSGAVVSSSSSSSSYESESESSSSSSSFSSSSSSSSSVSSITTSVSTGASSYARLEELIPQAWRDLLKNEFTKPYWIKLKAALIAEEATGAEIYPPRDKTFAALAACSPSQVRVVIVGQDPYFNPGQAEGMSFSVPHGIAVPPSLKNMYKELSSDIAGFKPPKHGHLASWASQGVLLLNAALTVRKGTPNSHKDFGWTSFTDAILQVVNVKCGPVNVKEEGKGGVVFLLWGAFAQKKVSKLNKSMHLFLEAPHPSGLSASRGFFGCKHFSKCNAYLKKNGEPEIDWRSVEKA